MTDLLPPYHKPMTSELDCDLANDRVAALEAELERVNRIVVSQSQQLGNTRSQREHELIEALDSTQADADTQFKLRAQAEAEVALRDQMLRDIIERIALTPERWNGWTTEEVLADLRARAEKEAER